MKSGLTRHGAHMVVCHLAQEGCDQVPALATDRIEGMLACVKCARKWKHDGSTWTPLIRPTGDNVIILPDLEKPPSSIITIVEMSFTRDKHNKPRRAKDFSTGLVLAVGPGVAARKNKLAIDSSNRPTSRIFKGRNGVGENEPMHASIGDRVIVRHVYEAASTAWRGLLVMHDFDVLAAVEDEAAQ